MAEGGPSPPDLETQKNEINNLIRTPLNKGDVWYLVDNRWIKQWKRYVGYDNWDTSSVGEQSTHPGPVDNSPLFKEGSSEIREHLVDELDYVLVPQKAWDLLSSWYGTIEGQEPIARNVVEFGLYVKNYKVEVYLVALKLCHNNDIENAVTRKFSKADTIEYIEKEMRKIFNIPDNKETKLWNRYISSTYEHLSKKESTVQDTGLFQGQVLVIEEKNDDGTWPRLAKSIGHTLGYGSSSSGEGKQNNGSTTVMSTRYGAMGGYHGGYSYNFSDSGMGNAQPGLCGLSNLGNTCFMNSALQCMSNCPPLTSYFLEDQYWSELNTENPLGMKGEIAKSYGELVKIMWSGKYSYTNPRNFKMQVGKFAPQFSGYQQQDSQELMAFLLDGLHEDLNRIKKKPYIELRDADGRSDEIVAEEAWNNYRKRNDSIIVDIFHGLLKSTLVCPECSKISVTFDPFCYLTLPMPVKKERQIDVFFIAQDPMVKLVQFKLTVLKNGCISDLCSVLSRFTSVPPNKMLVADVYNHRFHRILQPEEGLSNILDRDDIFVYELPVGLNEESDVQILPVYFRQKRDLKSSAQLFGQPLIVAVPKKSCTYDTLYETILQKMARYVKVPRHDDEWWNDVGDDAVTNGEVDMGSKDDEESDSPVEEDVNDDEGIGSQEELENRSSDEETKSHYLFTINFVNSSGTAELDPPPNDGTPIAYLPKSYVAIDWDFKARQKFFDDRSAEDFEQHETMNYRPSQKKQVIQLNECLELYTAMERLSVDDSWYCPSCKKHQQATKKFDLWSLPQVLVLCFKRFSYNRFYRDKIDTLVEFPIKGLNMAKYIINNSHGPAMYDLIAVANHYGGLGGGHYTAYAKNKDDRKWYNFDDSSVTMASEDSVVSKAAYVLFYIRRDPKNIADIPAAAGAPEAHDNGVMSGDDDIEQMEIN